MNTEQVGIRQLKPWGSPAQMQRDVLGYQIDWESVSDFFNLAKWNIQLNGAAAVGADALTVDAIERAIRKGERIDFGNVETVVVTLDAASVDDTTVGCDALSGPIPSGAILKTADAKEFLKLTANAAAGAETLTVEALPNALEGGETATYQGGAVVVEVLEDVASGATSIPISNLDFPLADDSKGYLQKFGFGNDEKFIPEGTVMVKHASNGKIFPRRDATSEEAFALLASDASNRKLNLTDSRSGYGVVIGGTSLWENLLPDAEDNGGDLPSAYKTELAANSLGFTYRDYSDGRLSL